MKVILSIHDKPIGFLEWTNLNPPARMGELVHVVTSPMRLANVITRKLKTNSENVTISGGQRPGDVSRYWEGVLAVLNIVRAGVSGFDYHIPPAEDPFQQPTNPQDDQEVR
jgi:hypothetical protein